MREPLKHDVVGVITMENLIEAVLNMNILDEKDVDRQKESNFISQVNEFDFQDMSQSQSRLHQT